MKWGKPQVAGQLRRGSLAVEKILEFLVGHALRGLGKAVPVPVEGRLVGLGLWGDNLVLLVPWRGSYPEGDQPDLLLTGGGLKGTGEAVPVPMDHLHGSGQHGVGVLERLVWCGRP